METVGKENIEAATVWNDGIGRIETVLKNFGKAEE